MISQRVYRGLFRANGLLCHQQRSSSVPLHRGSGARNNHSSSQVTAFPVIESSFESWSKSDEARRNLEQNRDLFSKVVATRAVVYSKDDEVKAKDRSSRKLTVQERVAMLTDEGSEVLDIGHLAGLNMSYGTVYNACNVVSVAKIAGETCVISANIWTFKGGTLYPIGVKKQLRAQEISMENRLPCIYLVDSGGAFLPLQADIFPDRNHGGRVFRNQAILSSMGIPQISVVCGPCTAGGAYVPTMSDEAVIVKEIGSLYLAGPPLVKAATGEVISTENLGGADVHCGISGCTDHYVETEEEGFETARKIVTSLNLRRRDEEKEVTVEAPKYSCSAETFASLIPVETVGEGRWPALEVIARLVDGSRFHPFKEKYGPTLLTGFARINGRLVGILASNGELTATAATKGTHFVRLCTFRDIPIVFLQNTPSDSEFLAPEGNEGLTVKSRAQMMSAVACATVPKITVVVGGSYGPSSFAMGGRALQPNFLFSWPYSRLAVASPDHQLAVMRQQGLETSAEKEAELLERLQEEASVHPHSNLVTDAVILPHETRQVLSQALDACTVYRQRPPSTHKLNVLRM